jgi:16S rRNA processing protein RimM
MGRLMHSILGLLENFTRVGQIVGAFGLKGIVKVMAMTDFLDRFEPGSRLRLKGDWVEIESFTIHKKRPLIKLRGISSATQAEALKWEYLEVPSDQKPELDEGEFLTEDLIGMKVVTVDGLSLGEIDEVIAMPAHDVIQIGELLIPAVAEFVKDIDFDAGVMTVKLIPGMLPGEEA